MNKKIIPVIAFAIVFLLSLAAYHYLRKSDSGDVAGGPCSYVITNYPATIIAIEPLGPDPSVYEITFELNRNGHTDTLLYSMEFSDFLPAAELKKHQYTVGQEMTYEHQRIVTGSCTPDIFRLKMERFQSAAIHQSVLF